jgi:hypothetical protein
MGMAGKKDNARIAGSFYVSMAGGREWVKGSAKVATRCWRSGDYPLL